jgi:hypothetical protein
MKSPFRLIGADFLVLNLLLPKGVNMNNRWWSHRNQRIDRLHHEPIREAGEW